MLVPIDKILPKQAWNLRDDALDIDSLAISLEGNGQLTPVLVTPGLELLAGYRRYQALKKIGASEIDVKVIESTQLDSLRLIHIDENLERKDLNCAKREVALLEKFEIYKRQGKSKKFLDDVIKQTGLAERTVYKGLQRIKGASSKVQEAYENGAISGSAVDSLVKLPKDTQDEYLPQAMEMTREELAAFVSGLLEIPEHRAISHKSYGTIDIDQFARSLGREAEKFGLSLDAAIRSSAWLKYPDADALGLFVSDVKTIHSFCSKVLDEVG